jgi:monovalent cation/proton antiporter MnhG/PhaG subunit
VIVGVLAGLLLAGAVGAVLLACLGALALDDPYGRLHALSFAALVGPTGVALAVVVAWPSLEAALKALLLWLFSVAANPMLSHAMARALRAHEVGEHGR